MIRYDKSYCKLSFNSLAIITKQQSRINYIEKIRMKGNVKKIKYYHMPKKLLQAFGQFSRHDHKTTT